jgi:hypothetical protein
MPKGEKLLGRWGICKGLAVCFSSHLLAFELYLLMVVRLVCYVVVKLVY